MCAEQHLVGPERRHARRDAMLAVRVSPLAVIRSCPEAANLVAECACCLRCGQRLIRLIAQPGLARAPSGAALNWLICTCA
ncbi:MAG: hypothetical protein ACLP3Q_01780, partial [Streptosporangiaceae bacterium]